MPDLTITLNSNEYTIPPAGYVLSGLTAEIGVGCIIAISPVSDLQGMYILGDTFLRNFDTIFNYEQKSVSFSVSSNAPAGVTITPHANVDSFDITIIILSCFVVVAIIYKVFKSLTTKNSQAKPAAQYQAIDQQPLAENGPNQA